jgi:hypothetical protein
VLILNNVPLTAQVSRIIIHSSEKQHQLLSALSSDIMTRVHELCSAAASPMGVALIAFGAITVLYLVDTFNTQEADEFCARLRRGHE